MYIHVLHVNFLRSSRTQEIHKDGDVKVIKSTDDIIYVTLNVNVTPRYIYIVTPFLCRS